MHRRRGLSEQVKGETNLCGTQTRDACLDALLGWLCEPVSQEQLHPTEGIAIGGRREESRLRWVLFDESAKLAHRYLEAVVVTEAMVIGDIFKFG